MKFLFLTALLCCIARNNAEASQDEIDYFDIINRLLGMNITDMEEAFMRPNKAASEEVKKLENQILETERLVNFKRRNIQQLENIDNSWKMQMRELQKDPVKNIEQITRLSEYITDTEKNIKLFQEEVKKSEDEMYQTRIQLEQLRQYNQVPFYGNNPIGRTPSNGFFTTTTPNPIASSSIAFSDWYKNWNKKMLSFFSLFNNLGNRATSFFNKLKTDATAMMKNPFSLYNPGITTPVFNFNEQNPPFSPTKSSNMLRKIAYMFQ